MSFEYFYVGDEYEYLFYRLPKELVKDPKYKDITMEAKVLYGCMMDRHELSAKNGWHDEYGRIYIFYTYKQICEDLFVSRKKAAAMLDELEYKAFLIRRVRKGQGKANRIYVRRFHTKGYPQPVSNGNYQKSPMETSESFRNELQEVSGRAPKNTDITNTEYSETNLINPADAMEEMRVYFESTCNFESLKKNYPYHTGELDAIHELMAEICVSSRQVIRIGGEDKPAAIVKSRFEKMNSSHICYVMDSLLENTTKIKNIRQYLLTSLYNAPLTIDAYYTTLVHYDMAYGGI